MPPTVHTVPSDLRMMLCVAPPPAVCAAAEAAPTTIAASRMQAPRAAESRETRRAVQDTGTLRTHSMGQTVRIFEREDSGQLAGNSSSRALVLQSQSTNGLRVTGFDIVIVLLNRNFLIRGPADWQHAHLGAVVVSAAGAIETRPGSLQFDHGVTIQNRCRRGAPARSRRLTGVV